MVTLLNNVWHSAMVEFSRVKVYVVVGYGPRKGDVKEMIESETT